MGRLNQDTILAIFLLAVSGVLMVASFDIREPDYGQLSPAAWPRAIVIALGFLSFLFLVQSLAQGHEEEAQAPGKKGRDDDPPLSLGGFFAYWRNVIWCFLLFLLYLLTMPYLGMLIGGVTFAFCLMCALGGWAPRQLALHAIIALICVGGMWLLFTFGLNVPLPSGQILPRF